VTSTDGRVEELSDTKPMSVDIFETAGKWHCQAHRGEERPQPMGPYSKEQALRVQDIRHSLLARKGAAGLVFVPSRTDPRQAGRRSCR
jgi:hypothetical protein